MEKSRLEGKKNLYHNWLGRERRNGIARRMLANFTHIEEEKAEKILGRWVCAENEKIKRKIHELCKHHIT